MAEKRIVKVDVAGARAQAARDELWSASSQLRNKGESTACLLLR